MFGATSSDRLFMDMTAAAAMLAAVVSLATPVFGDPAPTAPTAPTAAPHHDIVDARNQRIALR